MNKEKLTQFFKDYGFYLAVGVVSIGAIIGVFIMPSGEEIQDTLNATTQNEPKAEEDPIEEKLNILPDLDLSTEESIDNSQIEDLTQEDLTQEDVHQTDIVTKEEQAEEVISSSVVENNMEETDVITDEVNEQPVETKPAIETQPQTVNPEVLEQPVTQEDATPEPSDNFESTTGENQKYFSDGDTFEWPVNGDVIVPYKDDNTSHWLSEGLNQTMRTFGICIEAQIGENVTPVAPGTIIDVTEDFTEIDTLINVGDVGQVMIIDHGNGYKSLYGFQKGAANSRLIGQIVSTEDVIGIAGKGTGPFIAEPSNIYLQVTHNDVAINPEELLLQSEFPHAVDMGYTSDQN